MTELTRRLRERLYQALTTRGGNRWSTFWFLVVESCFLSDFCCDLPKQSREPEVMEAYLNISTRGEEWHVTSNVGLVLMLDLDLSNNNVVAVSMMASQGCATRDQ